jgi:hypothetical protein
MARELVEVRLRWNGQQIEKFTTQADADDQDDLQGLLEDAVKRDRKVDRRHIAEYEIEVRRKRNGAHLITYVGRSR